MGFATKIQGQKARVYCLQYGTDTPDAAYFFLQVEGAKETAFLRALQQKTDLPMASFGTVVASGWGTPSPAVRERMQETYQITFVD